MERGKVMKLLSLMMKGQDEAWCIEKLEAEVGRCKEVYGYGPVEKEDWKIVKGRLGVSEEGSKEEQEVVDLLKVMIGAWKVKDRGVWLGEKGRALCVMIGDVIRIA